MEGLVTAGKPTLANRVQALISSIYSFAMDADLVNGNPCSRLRRRGVETVGRRVLTDDEIRLFWPGIVRKPVLPASGWHCGWFTHRLPARRGRGHCSYGNRKGH